MSGKGLASLGNVVSCNVRGLTNEKIPHLREKFSSANILLLQETHGHEATLRSKVERLGFQQGHFALLKRQARGSGVLVRKGTEIVHTRKDSEGRI